MSYTNWKSMKINPLEIKLDPLNPRVLLDNKECTQKNMRSYLLDYFEVINLANSIIFSGGLPPTEKILCIREDNKYIVVEGNRRLTALQLLISPELIPAKYKNTFPIAPEDLKKSLMSIEIALAPSRDSTEGYITLRHSGDNTKPWSRLAQNRRIILRYENEKQNIQHIANTLHLSRANVTKGIQFYYFIQYVIEELNWTQDELKIIKSPLLQTTKIDRFLPFGSNAKNIMQISFDENHRLQTKVQKSYFDKALKIITRKVFITDEINTRSTLKSVFNEEIKELCSHLQESPTESGEEKEKTIVTIPEPKTKAGAKTDTKTEPKTDTKTEPTKTKQPKPKERKFLFENLKYSGKHAGISRSLYEIQSIEFDRFKLSAHYLTRTLIECTLQEYLKVHGLFGMWKKPSQDPSITDLLNYCNQYKSFKDIDKNIQRNIEGALAKKDHDELNSVSHAKYNEPSSNELSDIEKRWYPTIKFLLEGLDGQVIKNSIL